MFTGEYLLDGLDSFLDYVTSLYWYPNIVTKNSLYR